MNTNKQLMFAQAITFLPFIIFLSLYVEATLWSYSASVILTLLLAYNIYRSIYKIALIRYPLLPILIACFLVYSFTKLGSTEAPQTFETLDLNNSTVSFKFDKIKQVDKFCYYSGIDNNSKFKLSSLNTQNQLKQFYNYNKDFPFSFRWQCNNVKIKASEIHLEITAGSLMLGEMRFMYDDLLYDDLIIEMQTDKSKVNDESELTVDTSYFGGMFFDEIYHSRTAYEMIQGLPLYDTSHPNLGKFLITPGIKAFGMTPFGWRIMNVVFAALFIVIFYYFSLQLFKNEIFAFSGALMVTYSFMHFTQARIGLIDTFGVFFVFTSFYFLYRFIIKQKLSPLLLSGLFFGLAAAVKWSAAFSSLGYFWIAIYLLSSRYPMKEAFSGYKLMLYGLLSYGILAVVVYGSTFYNIYLNTGSLKSIYWTQMHIYNYHAGLQATHPYSSDWWSWPLNIRPMSYYREVKDALFSSITVFGNPALFWLGILAIAYLIYVVIMRATLEATFILYAFLGLYIPYVFIGRLMFIYHFYYALPFMILALLYFWKDLVTYSTKFYSLFYLYLILVVALFMLFYPVLSGYKVPKTYVTEYLVWFKGWWF